MPKLSLSTKVGLACSTLSVLLIAWIAGEFNELALPGAVAGMVIGTQLSVLWRKIRIQMHTGKWVRTHNKNQNGPFSNSPSVAINPASGLPMLGGIDAEGNPYGCSDD